MAETAAPTGIDPSLTIGKVLPVPGSYEPLKQNEPQSFNYSDLVHSEGNFGLESDVSVHGMLLLPQTEAEKGADIPPMALALTSKIGGDGTRQCALVGLTRIEELSEKPYGASGGVLLPSDGVVATFGNITNIREALEHGGAVANPIDLFGDDSERLGDAVPPRMLEIRVTDSGFQVIDISESGGVQRLVVSKTGLGHESGTPDEARHTSATAGSIGKAAALGATAGQAGEGAWKPSDLPGWAKTPKHRAKDGLGNTASIGAMPTAEHVDKGAETANPNLGETIPILAQNNLIKLAEHTQAAFQGLYHSGSQDERQYTDTLFTVLARARSEIQDSTEMDKDQKRFMDIATLATAISMSASEDAAQQLIPRLNKIIEVDFKSAVALSRVFKSIPYAAGDALKRDISYNKFAAGFIGQANEGKWNLQKELEDSGIESSQARALLGGLSLGYAQILKVRELGHGVNRVEQAKAILFGK